MIPNALTLTLAECCVVVVAAALAGALPAWTKTRCAQALGVVLLWLGLLGGLIAVAGRALSPAGTAQVVILSAALAAAACGACFRSSFADVLDAAGCSVVVALTAMFGVLLAGPVAAELPQRLLDTALLTNPIVATASALDLDILRTEILYRVSPIAHRSFAYPTWSAASIAFSAVAAAALAAAALLRRETVAA